MNIPITIEEAKANGQFEKWMRFTRKFMEYNEKVCGLRNMVLTLPENGIEVYDFDKEKPIFEIKFKQPEMVVAYWTKTKTKLQQALNDLTVEFSHEINGLNVFNVRVTGQHTYIAIKRALCKKIELDDKSEEVISSRVLYQKPHIEVKTNKGKKLFVIYSKY